MTVWNSCCCCCGGLGGRRGSSNRIGVVDKKSIFLLMLGLDNAGKTCTAKSMAGESATQIENTAPTVGYSRVETKYKGYNVKIYDLGGSKGFRGIWPQYFHEVHGFIFVVDSADPARAAEAREAFREILRHDKVRGKPVLLLCNKSDMEEAQDEVELVDVLNVEAVVNEARCPTRVEPCVAVKSQGLKVGYKWLVKTIIASYSELGSRVAADIELERVLDVKRKKEARARVAEIRRKREEEDEAIKDTKEEGGSNDKDKDKPNGFIPLSELKNNWVEWSDKGKKDDVQIEANTPKLPPIEKRNSLEKLPKLEEMAEPENDLEVYNSMEHVNGDASEEAGGKNDKAGNNSDGAEIVEVEEEIEHKNGFPPIPNTTSLTAASKTNGSLPPPPSTTTFSAQIQIETHDTEAATVKQVGSRLDLEPITHPKKRRHFLRGKAGGGGVKGLHRSRGSSIDSSNGSSNNSKPNSATNSSVESVRDSQVIKVYTRGGTLNE